MTSLVDGTLLRKDARVPGVPLYRQIETALRDKIHAGAWPEGTALPSRRLLCEEFGTTRVTLDKAIQRLASDGLVSSTKGSGTFVTRATVSRRGSAPTQIGVAHALRIAVVLGSSTARSSDDFSWDDFYVGPLFSGLRDGSSGRQVDMTFAYVADGEYLSYYESSSLDGMILMAPALADLPMIRRLAKANVAFVGLGISPSLAEDRQLPCFACDNRQGAELAVAHLTQLGHRCIGCINLALDHGDHLDRLHGFLRGMAAAQMTVEPEHLLLNATYDMAVFEKKLDAWIDRLQSAAGLPSALFVCDYLMTLAVLRVLRRRGIRVPEDISIVSFDDPLSAEHLTPPLTTVRQPIYQMGCRAVERLLDTLRAGQGAGGRRDHHQPGKPAVDGVAIYPTELIIRGSTQPFSVVI